MYNFVFQNIIAAQQNNIFIDSFPIAAIYNVLAKKEIPFKVPTLLTQMQSNIESDLAASANMVISTSLTITEIAAMTGIFNVTGAGVVNIATLTKLVRNNFPVILKPQNGLTISIAFNNVANGFVNQTIITANGTNGEVINLTPVIDRWIATN